jgi:mono/diheme cytochrome c family protein
MPGAFRFPPIVLLVGVSVATSLTAQGRPTWPVGLQTVADESPRLTPEAEMKTFVLPPGYRVELVASEPMVEEPVLIDWDPAGRMWVIEMLGYMEDILASTEREPTGRISVLEDTNDDGAMDRKTVFMDRLVLPRALKVLDKGVLIAEPPHLWYAADANGDLKADSKELVCDCYGTAMANVEHNANSLLWALDNWMHTSEGNVFLRRKQGKFEIRSTLSRGQWGATQDDVGRVYRNSNSSALHVDLVPTPYYARHPGLLRTRGSYEFAGDQTELNRTFPVRPNRGVNRGYQDGTLRADGTLARYSGVNAPTVYRGDRLPADLAGNVFLAEPTGNLVSRVILDDNGRTITGRKAYENAEFLASTDERFRPVYLSSAPDGTLYIVDMYHGIIQHRGYITEYLRDQILSRKLEAPIRVGRIFRVMHETTQRGPRPNLSQASAAALVETLSHPNGWWRDTAQRLLVERNDPSVVASLKTLAETAADVRTRLHALWTLDGTDRIEPATVIRALDAPSRDVRAAGVRIAERFLAESHQAVIDAMARRADDADWSVRQQLAASLGAMPPGPRETAVASLLQRHATDPVVMDAALSGLRGAEPAVLARLLQASASTPELETAITMLSGTIIRGGQDAAIQQLFLRASEDARPEWQRSALLGGAEIALLNAAMPGTPAGGRGRGGGGGGRAAADGTAPGQRGGPGGSPAFPRAGGGGGRAAAGDAGNAAAATAGGRGRGGRGGGGGGAALQLTTEPALSRLTPRPGDLGARATALLARIEWPGKPGMAAPLAPLTAAEQARFTAGRAVYESLCTACHQPDGRGQDRVAPSLLGSRLALAPAAVPVRVLVNGKEGATGLMPPLGAALSDDQIASVLTYIRREWGQRGSPVDVGDVTAARTLTVGRTRPWTDNELLPMVGGTAQ